MDHAFASLCVRKLDIPDANPTQQLPLFLSSSFSFEQVEDSIEVFEGRSPGYVYSRYGNPTIDAVAHRIAALEGFELGEQPGAYMTSSGMAAIHVLLVSLLPQGGKVLTQSNLYGGTTELFSKVLRGLGIIPIFEDLRDPQRVTMLLENDPEINVIYLETPTNPCLECLDLHNISEIAHTKGCKTIVDNTFSTPYLQRPLSLGIDFVIHSTTKYINGHGTGIAGIIVGRDADWMAKNVFPVLKLTGATCNPFDAWMVANGLRTLPVRMDRHMVNAEALAQWLHGSDRVNHVFYPGLANHPTHAIAKSQMMGFGGMLSFEVDGGREGAIRVMNKLKVACIAPTLGDVDTLILHPRSSSHLRVPKEVCDAQGITEGLIRVSVGLEFKDEIIADFEQALRLG